MLMSFRCLALLVAVVIASLAFAASADAITLGEITSSVPKSASCEGVGTQIFLIQASTTGNSYSVPEGGGLVTSWSTSFGVAGAELALLVLRPSSPPSKMFTVVGEDKETLPTSIPSNHITKFTIASPIATEPKDEIALVVPPNYKGVCVFEAGSASDQVDYGEALSGGTLTTAVEVATLRVNVQAELTQSADMGLTQTVSPSPAPSGGVVLIQLHASNAGPATGPATVTDALPSALPVLAAGVSGSGGCTVAAQAVSCTLSEVAPGASPTVDIIAQTPTPGMYTNQALIAGANDPNLANDIAGATITVAPPLSAPAPVPPTCTVISLAKTPLSVAEAALRALHCGIGKVTKASSKTVAKGLVISTSPGAGATLAAGSAVNIVTSSGPPKKKKHTKKKKH